MITYLKKQNVENYCAIFLHNNNIIKKLKYEKFFFILKRRKIQSFVNIAEYFNAFQRKFQLKKKSKIEIKKK
jgi:hypothetical protein